MAYKGRWILGDLSLYLALTDQGALIGRTIVFSVVSRKNMEEVIQNNKIVMNVTVAQVVCKTEHALCDG